MIHSIEHSMYTGSSLSLTAPWTISTLEKRFHLTIADTIAHPSPPFLPPVSSIGSLYKFSLRSCSSQTFLLSLASAASSAAQCSLSTQSLSTLQSSSIAFTSSAPLSASRQTPLTVLHSTEHFVKPDVPSAITLAIISI